MIDDRDPEIIRDVEFKPRRPAMLTATVIIGWIVLALVTGMCVLASGR